MSRRLLPGRAVLCGAAVWLPCGPAQAGAPVVERLKVGAADRVIILSRAAPGLAMRQDGATLIVDLPPDDGARAAGGGRVAGALAAAARGDVVAPGAWVRAMSAVPGHVRLSLAPGARPRVHVLADRIIIDVDASAWPLPAGQFRPAILAEPGLGTGFGHPEQATPLGALPNTLLVARLATPGAGPGMARLPGLRAAPFSVPGRAAASAPMSSATGTLTAPVAPVAAAPVPPVSRSTQREGSVAAAIFVPAVTAASASPQPPPVAEPPSVPPAGQPAGHAEGQTAGPFGTQSAAQPAPQPVAVPMAPSVVLLADDGTLGGPSILLPAARLTGAAAFTRDGELRVVLDSPGLLDLSQLKDDPIFGSATERLLPDGSELRLRANPATTPRLTRREAGWELTLARAPGPLRLVTGTAHAGVLALAVTSPGRVVALEDETTGGRLLVGTQRDTGQRVVAPHHAPEWALLPSWQGVVVHPLSDRVRLADKEAGFEVRATEPPGLALLWPDTLSAVGADGRAMTRRFDFPGQPPQVLHSRLAAALRDAATTPQAGRASPRVRVAEAMLASGMDAEAAAVLQVAATDDPAIMGDPVWHGLSAIAAWLSAEAGGASPPALAFDAARLGDSDEAALWRGLWGTDQAAAAAAAVSARWRLLLAYPEGLRRKMLPAVAALLARGGQDGALAELLAAAPEPSLDLARAGLLQRQGKPEEALRLLDRVAAGNDRLARAQASEAAVEQRLAAGKLTQAAAAGLLDKQIYVWRGGGRELRIRQRAASLHAEAGDWRAALTLLRDTDTVFPESHDVIHAAEVAVVSTLLHSDRVARLGALDLMALADEASLVLGAATAEAALAPLLADKLLALDLPERAEPILRRLLAKAAGGPGEAALQLRLAGLLADKGDSAGALALLDRPANAAEDRDLTERRALLRAGLLARGGRTNDALAALAPFSDRQAVEAQASLREGLHDWDGAEHGLLQMAAMPGLAEARQALALRAARDATEAGDMAGLHAMRLAYGPLFAGSTNAGLFAVLTAEPVAKLTDLPRAASELATIRALPAALTVTAAK